jgi:hypothetical protein
MDLIHDVLDKQLKDASDQPIGRVDGIVMQIEPGEQPRVVRIETGFPTLFARLHPRLGRCVAAFGRRYGLRRGKVTRIPWSKLDDIGIEVHVKLEGPRTRALAWEQWLKRHIMSHIPGSGT